MLLQVKVTNLIFMSPGSNKLSRHTAFGLSVHLFIMLCHITAELYPRVLIFHKGVACEKLAKPNLFFSGGFVIAELCPSFKRRNITVRTGYLKKYMS